MRSDKKTATRQLTMIGLLTAVTCVLGPLSIPLPFSPVPISLTNFAVYIAVYLLGTKRGMISYTIYMLIGLVGLPVFSNFSAGPAKFFGPTGGYIIGFLFMALVAGLFVNNSKNKFVMHVVGMILGTIVCYAFGTAWLAYQAGMTFKAALMAGVIPFIPGDLVKIFAAALICPKILSVLKKSGYGV